jgi:3-hydroxyisobutyrate dehydrogenase-like beta-hydroxyacid dehydrogenase
LETGRTCGFIGLGSQGAPMARRMVDAGLRTVLWARRESSLDPYRETHAIFARTVEELGEQVDHLGLCVVNDDDVLEMTARLIPVMREKSLIAIHSTVHPDTCREVAAKAAARGILVLDAPVSGGSPAAEAGKLTVMVGGDADAFAIARPVFETFAGLIVLLGDVGAGQYVKLINNSLFVGSLGLADAALKAGSDLGLDRESLFELLLASSGRSFALDVRARMDSPAGFRHGGALLRKDLKLLGEVLGGEHPAAQCFTNAAQQFLAEASLGAG